MKTNLDKIFKTNQVQESEGIWLEIADGVAFRVKRFGGYNAQSIKSAIAKYQKPYAKNIANLPEEKQNEIYVKVFVEACIVDWKGIEIDGELKPYSFQSCVELLVGLPELTSKLIEYSQDMGNYKDDLGNS